MQNYRLIAGNFNQGQLAQTPHDDLNRLFFCKCINPLPDDKILGLPEMKAFVDDKLNVTQNVKVVFNRIENIVGKEENAGYQYFLLFPQCFQKAFSSSASKVVIVW